MPPADAVPEGAPDAVPGTGPIPLPMGTLVRLRSRPDYLKTADPMPMLRPPDLVDTDEVGRVVAQRALGLCAVRFRRGTFLLNADQLIANGEQDRPSG